MRCIIMLLAVFAPLAIKAQKENKFSPYTYVWLEGQTAMEKSEVGLKNPVIGQSVSTLTFGHQASQGVGVVATLAHANTSNFDAWSEVTLGWSFATKSGLEISFGPALERVGKEYHNRARVNIFYDHEASKNFFYGQFDAGQGASWYWVDGAMFVKKILGVGFLVQMPDLGVGPKLELRMGKYISVWGAGLRQPDTKVEYRVFGLRLKYDK